ncbi:DUF3348 domain-containing protein [Pusillimonas harenae]|uniref:DUF3348 domain-containing protein n=1 Tax=Pollutimonas harenae TaxID=657015 RepID=A0A853GWR5_9BURK|nr:DUF3348 domain-containing protein [Pollutimonas harenae]NYT86791.1 DUF3348 domain-containing protein [Pollutimonas harenae]TEA71568.1 DUF3348 family protein [Pollutimonas harenae]
MQESARRTSFSGPALVRLLSRLNNADIAEPVSSLSDRLSQWLGWSDAIALGAALSNPASATPQATAELDEDQEYARVCKALSDAIAAVNIPAPARHRGRQSSVAQQGQAVPMDAIEFSTYRQRYISLQQIMETRCTELRTRLRAVLAGRSPDMARLAAVDAVMEQAMNEREFSMLARVPVLLEAHFKRLKQAALEALANEDELKHVPSGGAHAWLNVFHEDMQSVLFAELDIRLQPAQGLLAALARRP